MAIRRATRPEDKPQRLGLNSLTMQNSSPDFNDPEALTHWNANLTAFRKQAEDTYDLLLSRGRQAQSEAP